MFAAGIRRQGGIVEGVLPPSVRGSTPLHEAGKGHARAHSLAHAYTHSRTLVLTLTLTLALTLTLTLTLTLVLTLALTLALTHGCMMTHCDSHTNVSGQCK